LTGPQVASLADRLRAWRAKAAAAASVLEAEGVTPAGLLAA
jgi:hypothetical protein